VTPASYLRALLAELRPPAEERAREGPHAQFGEDRALERVFAGVDHGYCVEVGAYDGRTGSATYLFERKGWDCLLVEPNPALAQAISRHRHCQVSNCAASSREGEATFHVARNLEQMSTLDMTTEHDLWIRDLGGSLEEITVPTARLDTLLAKAGFPRVDFITIDVEGHELDVLQGFSLDTYRPRIVIVEDNGDQDESSVRRHLADQGYVNFKRTGVNDWYASESDAALVRPEAIRHVERRRAVRRWLNRLRRS